MKEKKLLLELMEIPSVSSDELAIGNFIFALLETMKFDQLEKIIVDENGFNIFAQKGNPKVMLQAHMDTVPGFIPLTEKDGKIYGRGSCDTKGSIAGMISAAEMALAEGINDFALLFTIGEEDDFRGIEKFIEEKENWPFAVVGEPTNLQVVNGQYGLLNLEIKSEGKAAHTSVSENGINAIDKLLKIVSEINEAELGESSSRTLSVIEGGIQDNIVPAKASALFNFRVAPDDKVNYLAQFQKIVDRHKDVRVEKGLDLLGVSTILPEKLKFLGETSFKKGATELGYLKKGIILGPGSSNQAHKEDEFVEIAELSGASQIYFEIIKAMAK